MTGVCFVDVWSTVYFPFEEPGDLLIVAYAESESEGGDTRITGCWGLLGTTFLTTLKLGNEID